jgi:phage terminase large subunit
MAEVFTLSGVPLMRADNNRVQGHMLMLNMMAPIPLHDPAVKALFPAGKAPDKLPALMFFDTLKKVISDIESIQADDRNPNDCAKQPHEITHTVDGVRYFCISRAQVALRDAPVEEPDEDEAQDYESYMCGGSASASYISC